MPATRRFRQHRGVVMVVVLFILAILGVLMLEINLSGQESVRRAAMLLDRAQSRALLKTRESELLLELLTTLWVPGSASGDDRNGFSARWRFDGQPFVVRETTVRLQDVAGLLVMPQPGFTSTLPMVERLLGKIGVDSQRSAAIIRYLSGRMEGVDRVPLQELAELAGVDKLTEAEVDKLRQVATLYRLSTFNPFTAPPVVLELLYQGSQLEGLVALRDAGTGSASAFEKIIGNVDLNGFQFSPGPAFQMDIEVLGATGSFGAAGIVVVDPYAPEPVTWWFRRGISPAVPQSVVAVTSQ